jgi:site-specific recombinase XerD
MKYLRQDHFLNKYWSPIVHSLVEDGVVSKYLPTKNLRQSFITRMIRQGYDVATIARLVGNTPQTIHANYLAAKDDLIPPSFDF